MEKTLNIYIGWDPREGIAADVCKFSIQHNASIPINVVYLKQDELRANKIYTREADAMASTQFTFTRFLVPYLNDYKGWAIFVDCDFVWTDDVAKLLELADPEKAVMVVQHDYRPAPGIKMDGQVQTPYPRKNWSSMILWNCEHPSNRVITPDVVNTQTAQFLHRFSWLKDHEIGDLPPAWNWLVGWHRLHRDGTPSAIHYTEGGPWFSNYQDCEFAGEWNKYRDLLGRQANENREVITIDRLTLPPATKQKLQNYLDYLRDPYGRYHDRQDKDILIEQINAVMDPRHEPTCIGVAYESDETSTQESKVEMDPVLNSFILGSQGIITGDNDSMMTDTQAPLAVRGIAKRKTMHKCAKEKRDFYYIDTGYFGNGKSKMYHRVTKNNLQYAGPLWNDCPDDRWKATGEQILPHRPGRKILVCPPSQKAMMYWGLDLEKWLEETVDEIRRVSGRPVEIRNKPARRERLTTDSLAAALANDVHCLVTFNSIAAVEALMMGKPVFTLGPNAATPLANTKLENIDEPFMPTVDQVRLLCVNLAYNQFSNQELRDGTAWRILQENYTRIQEQDLYTARKANKRA